MLPNPQPPEQPDAPPPLPYLDLMPFYHDSTGCFVRMGTPSPRNQANAIHNAASARRPAGNRHSTRPRFGDRSYTEEELELLREIVRWRSTSGKSCLENIDVFRIMKDMGYVRVPHGYRLVPIDDAPEAALRIAAPN